MKISIFGLGYVGLTASACLAKLGHNIIGIDNENYKVDSINQKKSHFYEPGVDDLVHEAVSNGQLIATSDFIQAVQDTEVSFICVGTPSLKNGKLDLYYIEQVLKEIGAALKHKNNKHIIVMRSTVLPSTAVQIAIPLLEETSGKVLDKDFFYVSNPEFLREGTAVNDFLEPTKTVIGANNLQAGDRIEAIYKDLNGPKIRTDITTAEMVKYTDNIWHGVKITFTNEIGSLAKAFGVDGQKVMDVFYQDTKLNLSTYYLKPGYAFGGSCLPKDIRAMVARAEDFNLQLPLITHIIDSNMQHIERALTLVKNTNKQNILLLGLSFKVDTDDLRESAQLILAEKLIAEGLSLSIYDNNVYTRLLNDKKNNQLNKQLTAIFERCVPQLEKTLEQAEVLLLMNGDKEYLDIIKEHSNGKMIIDLAHIRERPKNDQYEGICW